MSQELKPCPFCGSINLNVTEESSYVMCYGCDADGPVIRPGAAAIAAWNNRPDPAPPACREVEVLAFLDAQGDVMNSESGAVFAAAYPGYTELVDRSHATRLQAVNAALQARLTVADQKVDDLQSELTKARELLDRLDSGMWYADSRKALGKELQAYLARQSAPAEPNQTGEQS